MKYTDKIIKYFEELPEGTVVVANELYEQLFSRVGEDAFFRNMERLSAKGLIERIGKGLYIKASDADKDKEEMLLNYFFGNDNDSGMFIGYRLYNKYSLTDVKSDRIELYSQVIRNNSMHIGNIYVKKPAVELNFENTRIIEALEIMADYDNIEGLDKHKFARFVKQFSRGYDDSAAVEVIRSMRYKKCTIAFLKKILDMYKVKNSLSQFLSYASDYKTPTVQKLVR
ncbi:MAG: hypothetical protein ACI4E1_06470 [Lachnospira sp.]